MSFVGKLWVLAFLLATLVGCQGTISPLGTPSPPSQVLSLGLDDSVRPLVNAMIPVYGDEQPMVRFEIEFGNTAGIMQALRDNRLEAGLVLGEPAGEPGWWQSAVAIEALVLIVNRENQVAGLSLPQAQALFSGGALTWDQVGGTVADVEVAISEEGSSTRDLFLQMVMAELPVTLSAVVLPDQASIEAYVVEHPGAIGFAVAATVGEKVRVLAIEGQYPTLDDLHQNYPLTIPVYFVSTQEPVGQLRDFLAWMLSSDGQAVINRHYGRVR